MKKVSLKNWKVYGAEFLSIFVAVISAFALNNWNDNRKDAHSESKILIEISNGLEKDLEDIRLNVEGHQLGISACRYFRDVITDKHTNPDSLVFQFHKLTRDFVSIQNTAGYETLKSKGLELVENDSLRLKIIALYEYDYKTLQKLEEEYHEMQFALNYFKDINAILVPRFITDDTGAFIGLDDTIEITDREKRKLLMYLWKIEENRKFILMYYQAIEANIHDVRKRIETYIS